jgi:hypothetical protein
MGILEKLRPAPRWKHTDPTVRVSAIYELGPDESDVLHTLGREDGEARVRRAAAARIDNVAVLSEIARTDPDEDVRNEAVRGLAGIAAEADNPAQAMDAARQLLSLGKTKEVVLLARQSSSADVRGAIVDALDDPRSLGSVSRHALDSASRLRALGRIDDPEELLNVAVKAEHTDVAVAALERLTDQVAIAAVSQRARNKVAGRRAKARLRLLEQAAHTLVAEVRMSVEDRQRAMDLLHRAESLVVVTEPEEAGEALAAMRLAWAELQADVEVDAALVQEFESAIEAVREAITQRDEERAAELQRAEALAREQASRTAICDEILTLSGPGAADRIAELKVRWDSLPPMPSEYAASLTRRFQDACRQFSDRERRRQLADAAAGRLETLAAELEQLIQSGLPPEEIVARWRGLRRDADVLREFGDANPGAAERVERSVTLLEEQEQQQSVARAKQEQDNLRRLNQTCRQVEILAAAERVTLKAAERALNDIRAALDSRAPLPSKKDRQDIQSRLEAARDVLGPRLQALREADEWQRWANLQVQETLCREMEGLKALEDLEVAGRRMRELQARWKQVALVPRAQGEVMWRRFKAAQDEVFVRTAAHAAAQREVYAANLARKMALCEQAEALASSSDWVRTATAIQALQAEWKSIGPVTRGHERATWERFRAACDRFFTRRQEDLKKRKEEWAANLARKEALCVAAEALVESTDWDVAASQVRKLQAEWKTIGPVKKTKSEVIWQRFRDACDRFFERYKHRDQLQLLATAAPREAVIRDLEALVRSESDPAPDTLSGLVQDARARWQKAPDLPRHLQQELAVRYHSALAQLVEKRPAAFAGTDLDPEVTRKRMEKLVEVIEGLGAGAQQTVVQMTPTERLAQQLRERLATNTIQGGRSAAEVEESRWRAAEQEVRSAQSQWARLGPVPASIAGPLNERFQRACRRFFEGRENRSDRSSRSDRSTR